MYEPKKSNIGCFICKRVIHARAGSKDVLDPNKFDDPDNSRSWIELTQCTLLNDSYQRPITGSNTERFKTLIFHAACFEAAAGVEYMPNKVFKRMDSPTNKNTK